MKDHFAIHFNSKRLFVHFQFKAYLFYYYLHPKFQKTIHFDLANLLITSFHLLLESNFKGHQKYLEIILDYNLN